MKIKINTPQSINHIGGRGNNEDSIYPLVGNTSANDNLFLVCDGVGGNEKGEVASRLACDKFAEYFKQNKIEQSNQSFIGKALKYTESAFDKYFEENSQSKGMATTLTLLHLHGNGVTVAHVGDSRVYQYRKGEIVFQTSDHSLVNDLLKAGVINEEQAKDHPRKNVISRAIQGSTVKTTQAEVNQITDIQVGDYFFLCSDGILENISDFEIGKILNQSISDKEKTAQMLKRCEISPNDNFTCYLVPIKEVEGAVVASQNEETIVEAVIDESPVESVGEPEIESGSVYDKLIKKVKKILPLLIIVIGLALVINQWRNKNIENATSESTAVLKDSINDKLKKPILQDHKLPISKVETVKNEKEEDVIVIEKKDEQQGEDSKIEVLISKE